MYVVVRRLAVTSLATLSLYRFFNHVDVQLDVEVLLKLVLEVQATVDEYLRRCGHAACGEARATCQTSLVEKPVGLSDVFCLPCRIVSEAGHCPELVVRQSPDGSGRHPVGRPDYAYDVLATALDPVDLHPVLTVDAEMDGSPYANVVKRLAVKVELEALAPQVKHRLQVNVIGVPLEHLADLAGEQRSASLAVVVSLTGDESGEARGGVLDFEVVHAFEEWQALAPVVRVGADLGAYVLHTVDGNERAGAGAVQIGHVSGLVPAVRALGSPPLDEVLVHVVGHSGHAGELADRASAGFLELGSERVAHWAVRTGRSAVLEVGQAQARSGVGYANVLKGLRRVDGKLQAGGRVFACEVVASNICQYALWKRAVRVILEPDALAQLERDDRAVAGHVPRRGKIRQDGSGEALPRVELDQRVVRGQELRALISMAVVRVVPVQLQVRAVSQDAAIDRLTPLRLVARAGDVLCNPVAGLHHDRCGHRSWRR